MVKTIDLNESQPNLLNPALRYFVPLVVYVVPFHTRESHTVWGVSAMVSLLQLFNIRLLAGIPDALGRGLNVRQVPTVSYEYRLYENAVTLDPETYANTDVTVLPLPEVELKICLQVERALKGTVFFS